MTPALLLAALLAADPGPGPEDGAALAPFGAAGASLGTFHGLAVKALTLRGGVRSGVALQIFGEVALPLGFEAGVDATYGRTPSGLDLADTVGSFGLVLGARPFRGVLGLEAGVLWRERATRGEWVASLVAGPRAALLFEVPLRALGGRRVTLELGVRWTERDWVRGGLLAGLAL